MDRVLHIFPSMAATEVYQRSLLYDRESIFGHPALTMRRLAEELSLCTASGRRLLSPVGRRLILEQIVSRRYAQGEGRFAPLRRFPGFTAAAGSVISELKQALVSPSQLSESARRMPDAVKIMEIAALYADYEALLSAKGLMDHHDVEMAAIGQLSSSRRLPLLEGSAKIHFHDMYDFTPLQISLIAALSRRLPVVVEFPYDFERPSLFSYVSRSVDAFEALDDPHLQLDLRFSGAGSGFLSPLLSQLFRDGDSSLPAPEGISLLAAPNPYRECEEIGRKIRGLIENGVDPSRVAVMFRHSEPYGGMMEEVCRRFRIPVSFRRGAPLFTSPLVKTLLAPLEIVESRYDREKLLALLKSSYFPPLHHKEEPIHPDRVEDFLIRAQYVDASLEPLKTRASRWIASRRKKGESCGEDESLLRALLPLMKELALFEGKKGISVFTALLDSFIERHDIYRRGIEGGDARALKRDASAITLFQKVLQGLHDDLGILGLEQAHFLPGDLLKLLRQGMSEEFLAGERTEGVTILNFHDARGLRFDHVFAAGLNDGACPSRHEGHPLFKDEEKASYNRISGRRCFRTSSEKGLEEPLLFYLAISSPRVSLTLSYSYAGPGGNPLLRSPFLDEVIQRSCLSELRIPASPLTPPPERCLAEEELIDSLAFRKVEAGSLPLSLRGRLHQVSRKAAMEAERDVFFRIGEQQRRTAASGPYTGTIRRPELAGDIRTLFERDPGNTFPPTALEAYGRCPFRFFIERVIKARSPRKPAIELEATEEGILVHLILQRFFSRCQKERRLPLRGTEEEILAAREEAEAVFALWEQGKYTGERTLWELEKKKAIGILEALIAAEGGETTTLVPAAFEADFPPLEIDNLQGAPVYLKGKIDRIDVDPQSGTVRVVDYKMGGNGPKYMSLLKKESLGEISFQVPVYLLAAARQMEKEYGAPFTRFMARFWLLRRMDTCDREFGGGEDFNGFFSLDKNERETLGEDNFANRLCRMVEAIRSGDYQITPKEGCDFCDYPSVCRHTGAGIEET